MMFGWQLFLSGIIIFFGVVLKIIYRCGFFNSADIFNDNLDNMPFWLPFQELLTYRAMILSAFVMVFMGAILAVMHI